MPHHATCECVHKASAADSAQHCPSVLLRRANKIVNGFINGFITVLDLPALLLGLMDPANQSDHRLVPRKMDASLPVVPINFFEHPSVCLSARRCPSAHLPVTMPENLCVKPYVSVNCPSTDRHKTCPPQHAHRVPVTILLLPVRFLMDPSSRE